MTETVLPKFKQKIESWTMVPSGGGKFEIEIDGKVAYSKLETGKFPENKEIVALIEKHLAAKK